MKLFDDTLHKSFLNISGKEDLAESRITRVNENKAIDEKYGFSVPKESGEKIGYLTNMHSVSFVGNIDKL